MNFGSIAVKEQYNLLMAISGISSSGKTYNAMKLLSILGNNEPFAVIDTEKANVYADQYTFYRQVMTKDTALKDYLSQVELAAENKLNLLIDSGSAIWSRALIEHNKAGGRYQDWGKINPVLDAIETALENYPKHVIVTYRSEYAYELQKNENGKPSPVALGLKPDARKNSIYEYDIWIEMIEGHNIEVKKSRCPDLLSKGDVLENVYSSIEKVAGVLLPWLDSGYPKETSEVISKVITWLRRYKLKFNKEHELATTDFKIKTKEEIIEIAKTIKKEVTA